MAVIQEYEGSKLLATGEQLLLTAILCFIEQRLKCLPASGFFYLT